jgi:hypothetical protein
MIGVDRETLTWIISKIAHDGIPDPRDLDSVVDRVIATFEVEMSYQKDYIPYTPLWGKDKELANMSNVLAIKHAEGGGSLLVFSYVKDARGEPQPMGEYAKEPPSYFMGH